MQDALRYADIVPPRSNQFTKSHRVYVDAISLDCCDTTDQ